MDQQSRASFGHEAIQAAGDDEEGHVEVDLEPTAEERASMWKKRTASERAFSMSIRCAYRVMSFGAELRWSLVRRRAGRRDPGRG